MKLTVTGRHIEITEGIKDHLNQKIEKTLPEMGDDTDIHVALAVDKHRHHVEVTLKAKHLSLNSKSETDDLYTAMDTALEKMEKQIRKDKDRRLSLKIKQGTDEKKNQPL